MLRFPPFPTIGPRNKNRNDGGSPGKTIFMFNNFKERITILIRLEWHFYY